MWMAKAAPTSPYEPDVEQLRSWLESMIAAFKFVELVTAIILLVTRMRDLNTQLTQRLGQLTRKRPRSETLERIERQLALPFDVVATAPPRREDAGPAKVKKKRRAGERNGGGRNDFPLHLERVPVANLLPEEQRYCPVCGEKMRAVRHSICERLTVIPARLVVEQRMDETLACPNDDTIVRAPAPPAIVEGGKLTDTFIVEATCEKYIEHQPIERQCQRWSRSGVDIAPQTLGRGVSAHLDLLKPLADLICEQTRAPGLLGTDATGLPILDPDAPDGVRSGTMWCWTNARWVSFFYSPSGDADSVRRFLGGNLRRTVQCDGTSVTNFLERAGGKRPGCWAHARRYFAEAARAGDKIALDALRKMAPLFAIERDSQLAGDTSEERRLRRLEKSKPIVDDLRAFLDEQRQQVPPKTALGRALGYLHRQWPRLLLFLEDGNIELTNNRLERELRRLVLGRKNWLFTWLDSGGERTAAILTIVATCIAHEINPRAYLHIATRAIVHGWPKARLRELLPDRVLAIRPDIRISDEPEPRLLEA